MRIKEILLKSLGIILFIFILSRLDLKKLLYYYQGVSFSLIFLALIMILLFHASKAVRWHIILNFFKIHLTFLENYLMYISSLFSGFITPGRVGELSRIYFLKRKSFSLGGAVLGIILDRAIDIYTIFLIATASLFYILEPAKYWIVITFLILQLTLPFFILQKSHFRILKAIERFLIKIMGKSKEKLLVNLSHNFRNNFLEITYWRFFFLLSQSILIWLLYFFIILLFTRAVNFPLNFLEVVVYGSISVIFTFIPITIAGIGTRDAALIVLFSFSGYPAEMAVSFSLIALFMYIMSIFLTIHGWLLYPLGKIKPKAVCQGL